MKLIVHLELLSKKCGRREAKIFLDFRLKMEDIRPEELIENKPHRTYLVTYSQIDPKIFPTRVSFGAAVVQAFGANHVDYYAVSKEPHQSGGYHYHVAIRLNTGMRWHTVRDYLKNTFDVNAHFATSGSMYTGAYRYVTKSDELFFQVNCRP